MRIRRRYRASRRESRTTSQKNRVSKIPLFDKSKFDFSSFLPPTRWILPEIMPNSLYNLHNSTQAPGAGQRPIYPTFSQRFAPPKKYTAPPVARSSSVESDASHHSHSTAASGKDSVFDRIDRSRSVSTAATSTRGSVPPPSPRDKENQLETSAKSNPAPENNKSRSTTKSARKTTTRKPRKTTMGMTSQKLIAVRKTIERDALRAVLRKRDPSMSAETLSDAQRTAIQVAAVAQARRDGRLPKEVNIIALEKRARAVADRAAKEKIKSALVWSSGGSGSGGGLDMDMERLMSGIGGR